MLPGNFGAYYWRLLSQARRDLFKWGLAQVIGAVLALGILLLQIYWGVVPSTLTAAALRSLGWPYLVLIGLLAVAAIIAAPVKLDNARIGEIGDLQKLQRSTSEQLESAIEALKIDPQEQLRRDHVRQVLAKFSPPERAFMKWLAMVGSAHPGRFNGSGIPQEHCSGAAEKARRAAIVYDEHSRGMDVVNCIVQPDLRNAILAVLSEDGALG